MAEDVKRKISIFINGKEVEDSLAGIGREIGRINRELKKTSDPEERKRLNKELQNTRKRYGEIKEEINETNISIEEAKSHFNNLFSGVLTGNIQLIKNGFLGITGSLKRMTAAALGFIKTPLGATITALAALGYATKLWVDYNKELYKATRLTKQLTGLTGEAAREIRDEVSGVAEIYDKDFNEVLKASNSLAKQMKITHSEAVNLITQGFARGADVNGDFLEKVKEYPIQFKNAGYSAQDFIDVATQEAKGGVFNDKLLDTIKEINLSLKELDDTQVKVLENNFGEKYANQLTKDIDAGKISSKQAFQSIIEESKRVGLTVSQQQKIVADIMKSAGEDVGGFYEVINQLNQAFDYSGRALDDNEIATLRLVEATKNQNKALSDLFDASQSGFPTMLTNIKSIGKEIFTNFLRGIKFSTTSLKKMIDVAKQDGSNKAIADVIEDVKRFGSTKEEAVERKLKSTQKNIDRVTKQITELNFFEVKVLGTDKTLQTQLSKYIAYKDELLKIASDTSEKFKKEEDKYINPDNPDDTDKTDSEEQKAKRLAFQKAEKELDEIIRRKKQDRENLKKQGIDLELARIDAKYKNIEAKYIGHEDKLKELTKLKEQEKADLKLEKQKELQLKTEELEEENRIQKEVLRLEAEAEKDISDEARALLMLEKVKFLADEELRIEQEKELAKLKGVEGTEELIHAVKEKFRLKQEKSDINFSKQKEKIEKNNLRTEKSLTKERTQAYANMFGDIATLLGKNTAAGKAAAIAQATMNTYQGVTEVWAAKSVLPEPLATISKVASTGVVLASGLKSISSIKNTKEKGFYKGGFTGNKPIRYDDQDGIAYDTPNGPYHINEWVAPKIMVENPKYADNFAFLEKERKMLTKGYFNGGSTSNIESDIFIEEDSENVNFNKDNTELMSVLNKTLIVLENLETKGVLAVLSNDLRNMKYLKEGISEYEKLVEKNKR